MRRRAREAEYRIAIIDISSSLCKPLESLSPKIKREVSKMSKRGGII